MAARTLELLADVLLVTVPLEIEQAALHAIHYTEIFEHPLVPAFLLNGLLGMVIGSIVGLSRSCSPTSSSHGHRSRRVQVRRAWCETGGEPTSPSVTGRWPGGEVALARRLACSRIRAAASA